MNPRTFLFPNPFLLLLFALFISQAIHAQNWKLTPENIQRTIDEQAPALAQDRMRPAFHLTPPAGCMGDPNGGIYHDGWYHIFYGQHPFAYHPGGWYWAHARSRDLLTWEHLPPTLTPAFERGLNAVGSGSTIITSAGDKLAFSSQSQDGPLQFWKAEFTDEALNQWTSPNERPVLSLEHPGLPPYDDFWRDPFVFEAEGRTFMIACADLFEENYVPVPIFEAQDEALNEWKFKGHLFTVPKHRYRNLEVPEFRRLGDKWIFLASTDAPVDRVNYFLGTFDTETLTFIPEQSGIIDHSGHYYAQETIPGPDGQLILMGWLPGWDREWLPTYMNEPRKNVNPRWNGCFALPRELSLVNGKLIQQPVAALKELRQEHMTIPARSLPVDGPTTAYQVLADVRGNQLELQLELDLQHAAFCGLNVLCDSTGEGGLPIVWSGDVLNVDGVQVPLDDWVSGQNLKLQVFVDKKFVEVFVNGGTHCVSRQVQEEFVKGDHVALSSLGGTGRLVLLAAWTLSAIKQ